MLHISGNNTSRFLSNRITDTTQQDSFGKYYDTIDLLYRHRYNTDIENQMTTEFNIQRIEEVASEEYMVQNYTLKQRVTGTKGQFSLGNRSVMKHPHWLSLLDEQVTKEHPLKVRFWLAYLGFYDFPKGWRPEEQQGMTFKERFDSETGLASNWKSIISYEPYWKDELEHLSEFDLQTQVAMHWRGMTEWPKCRTCGKPVAKVTNIFCPSTKCVANNEETKAKIKANTDIAARSAKVQASLKARSPEQVAADAQRMWDTRRERYGETGFSEEGYEARFGKEITRQRVAIRKENWLRTKGLSESEIQEHKLAAEWAFDPVKFKETLATKGIEYMSQFFGSSFLNRQSIKFGIREKRETTAERMISEYIEELGFTVTRNSHSIIRPKEIDIYVEEKKLAIEYDGIYWHSCDNEYDEIGKEKYHLWKTEQCENKGITLLHIFDNEWENITKREIWKSVIKQKLGMNERVYARKCAVKYIEKSVAHEFCEENHLQGKTGCMFAKGLYHGEELVMVATFGKSRFGEDKLELIRMCTKKFLCVIGGASKLTKGMTFISYANRRWSSGNVYQKLNMTKVGVTQPNYFYAKYIEGMKLFPRQQFMKHKLSEILEVYDETLTESQNCYNNGFRKIFDCGNIKFETKT